MSVTTTSHPVALPGSPRSFFLASMFVQYTGLVVLVAGCVFLYGTMNPLGAGAICAGGGAALFGSWWMRDQSWSRTPLGALSYRAPTWVTVVNEVAGLMVLVGMIAGMVLIGSPLGFLATLFAVLAITGGAIVFAIRSAPEARPVRIVRVVALGMVATVTITTLVNAGGGLKALSPGAAFCGAAVIVLSLGVGAVCTFAWGRDRA